MLVERHSAHLRQNPDGVVLRTLEEAAELEDDDAKRVRC